MLKNLMKYDLKKMLKILVYIYAIALGLAGITRFINIWDNIQLIKIIGAIFASLSYSAVASVLINTFVYILRVFTTDFYKDESYLTHTLPISKNKLILSKFLSSLIVTLASFVVSIACLFIVLYSPELMEGLKALISISVAEFNMNTGVFILLLALVLLSQICCIITMTFCAVIKANQYNQKRIPKGLLWFFVFYFGSGYVSIMILALVFLLTGNISSLFASVLPASLFITILITGLVLYFVYTLVFYLIAQKLFNKGVNVD